MQAEAQRRWTYARTDPSSRASVFGLRRAPQVAPGESPPAHDLGRHRHFFRISLCRIERRPPIMSIGGVCAARVFEAVGFGLRSEAAAHCQACRPMPRAALARVCLESAFDQRIPVWLRGVWGYTAGSYARRLSGRQWRPRFPGPSADRPGPGECAADANGIREEVSTRRSTEQHQLPGAPAGKAYEHQSLP